jgi:hypothetical protein
VSFLGWELTRGRQAGPPPAILAGSSILKSRLPVISGKITCPLAKRLLSCKDDDAAPRKANAADEREHAMGDKGKKDKDKGQKQKKKKNEQDARKKQDKQPKATP